MADGSVDLLGRAAIRHVGTPVELLGKAEVGQGSAELLGKAEVGQDSADLLGKFEAQATAELLGKVIITRSIDLLGKFEAQATAELLGKVVITRSIDLLCKLRTSIPNEWIIQGVSVEAYITLAAGPIVV